MRDGVEGRPGFGGVLAGAGNRGRRWSIRPLSAQGSVFCRANRCGTVLRVKREGSSFAPTSAHDSGVATPASPAPSVAMAWMA